MQTMWMCLTKMTRAPFSPEKKLPDKKNSRFSTGQKIPDEELRSPLLQKNGLTGRRAIPSSMVIIIIKGDFFHGSKV